MLTPVKAIRENCIQCSGFSLKEVRLCPIKSCPLYSYRFGKNPNRKNIKKTFIKKCLINNSHLQSVAINKGE